MARLNLWWNNVTVGRGLQVHGRLRVRVSAGGQFIIGDNVRIAWRSAEAFGDDAPATFMVGPGAKVIIGSNVKIQGPIHIHARSGGRFEIGDNARIQSGLCENVVGWYMPAAIVVGPNAHCSVGSGAALSNCAIACNCSVTIGEGVFVGGGARIYDTDFHSLMPDERLAGDAGTKAAPIVLEASSFIGGHAIILKGSTVGKGAVLGAGALLANRVVPPGEVWAGNPARRIGAVSDIAPPG